MKLIEYVPHLFYHLYSVGMNDPYLEERASLTEMFKDRCCQSVGRPAPAGAEMPIT